IDVRRRGASRRAAHVVLGARAGLHLNLGERSAAEIVAARPQRERAERAVVGAVLAARIGIARFLGRLDHPVATRQRTVGVGGSGAARRTTAVTALARDDRIVPASNVAIRWAARHEVYGARIAVVATRWAGHGPVACLSRVEDPVAARGGAVRVVV